MKLPLVIIIVLIAFCAGGAGAYFFFDQPAVASTGDAASEKIEEKKKKEDEEGTEAKASNVYYKLDPLILPVINRHGLSQTISLVVAIEVKNDRARDFIKSNAPRLTDAYLQDMYGVLNKHAALNKGVIHLAFLKKILRHVTTKVVGEDKYIDVLIQVIQQRPVS